MSSSRRAPKANPPHDHPRRSGGGEPRMALPPGAAQPAALPAGSHPRRRRRPCGEGRVPNLLIVPGRPRARGCRGGEGRRVPEGRTAFPPCIFSGRRLLARAPRRALQAPWLRRRRSGGRGLVFREGPPTRPPRRGSTVREDKEFRRILIFPPAIEPAEGRARPDSQGILIFPSGTTPRRARCGRPRARRARPGSRSPEACRDAALSGGRRRAARPDGETPAWAPGEEAAA